MRPLLLLLILLAFPIAEVMLLVQLADRYGWSLLWYLIGAALGGWLLIQDERLMVFGRMAETLRDGHHPGRALLASAKKVIAGVLLMIPGVITDVVAVIILLMPAPRPASKPADDGVIEGEWRREE